MAAIYLVFVVVLQIASIGTANLFYPKLSCDTNDDCTSIKNSFCNAGDNYCTCLAGHIFADRDGKQECIENKVTKSCKKDADCTAKSTYCDKREGLCQCRNGLLSSPEKCLESPHQLGKDPCVDNEYCHAGFGVDSECVNDKEGKKVCRCLPNSEFVTNRCYKRVGFGDNCTVDYNCPKFKLKTGREHQKCIQEKCLCPTSYRLNANKTTCLFNADLFERCDYNEECTAENSVCSTGKCLCQKGYFPSKNNTVCLKTATSLDEDCVEEKQCENLAHAICWKGKCICGGNYHKYGDSCFKNVALNDPCDSDGECITSGSRPSSPAQVTNVGCYNGTCQCSPGHKFVPHVCRCVGFRDLDNSAMTQKTSGSFIIILLFIHVYRGLFVAVE